MSSTPLSDIFVWQGAADRKPVKFIALQVKSVRQEGGGIFGINRSPSLGDAMPDARLVEGKTIGSPGGVLRLRAPGAELPSGLGKGSRLVLGLVDAKHVICMFLPLSDVPDGDLTNWAAHQPCR